MARLKALSWSRLAAFATLTSLAIAAIAGIALNAILPGNDFYFGQAESDNSGSLGKY